MYNQQLGFKCCELGQVHRILPLLTTASPLMPFVFKLRITKIGLWSDPTQILNVIILQVIKIRMNEKWEI